MTNGINGIDHIVVAVSDLENARDTWTRLGFTCTPRGRHRNLATGNYCIMFPEDYVELIGIVDPSMPDRGLMSRMDGGGEGLDRVAFAAPEVDATVAALKHNGYGVRGPIDLHRPLELPEGEVEPRFRLVHFEDQASTPGLHGFICHHTTPEITRGDPAWLEHSNGVRSVASVTAISDDPAALADGWRKLLGDASAVEEAGRLTVFSGPHRLEFITRDVFDDLYPDTSGDFDRAAPCIAAAAFHVADTDATAAWLDRQGITCHRDRMGTVTVPADAANGAILSFIEEPRA